MHKWYDQRLFAVRSRDEILTELATPEGCDEPLLEAKTGAQLLLAGVDVRMFGEEPDGDAAVNSGDGLADVQMEVEDEVFCRWVETAGFALGSLVAKWWVRERVAFFRPKTSAWGSSGGVVGRGGDGGVRGAVRGRDGAPGGRKGASDEGGARTVQRRELRRGDRSCLRPGPEEPHSAGGPPALQEAERQRGRGSGAVVRGGRGLRAAPPYPAGE